MLLNAVTCLGLHGIVTRYRGKPATSCRAASAQTPASRHLLPQELCPGPRKCSCVIGINGCCPDTVDPPALVPRRKWAEHSGDCCSVRQGTCGTHFALVFQNLYKFWLTNLTQQCVARHNTTHNTSLSVASHSTALHSDFCKKQSSQCTWMFAEPSSGGNMADHCGTDDLTHGQLFG